MALYGRHGSVCSAAALAAKAAGAGQQPPAVAPGDRARSPGPALKVLIAPDGDSERLPYDPNSPVIGYELHDASVDQCSNKKQEKTREKGREAGRTQILFIRLSNKLSAHICSINHACAKCMQLHVSLHAVYVDH